MIQTRAQKALAEQSARTRKRAEVYTPCRTCRMMCDYLDQDWFHRKDGFYKTVSGTNHISFSKSRTWTAYIKSRRLEITCGEAPYLASRYDAPTGRVIPLAKRAGLLDRKLRVIGENTTNESEWIHWTAKAFRSIYGFEFQGDSLLIARINLLMTFGEYFTDRWGHAPRPEQYWPIADIVVWNLFQMEGLTQTIPYQPIDKYPQMVINGWLVSEVMMDERPKPCRIYDWHNRRSLEYRSLREKGDGVMKFDFIIGNPPYQEEAEDSDNKAFMPPIYNLFIDEAYEVSDKVELIHPARFLFNAGQTPKAWNEKMLADEHLKILYHEQDSSRVFSNTNIMGGVVISYHDSGKEFGAIGVYSAFAEMNTIMQKVKPAVSTESLMDIIYNQNRFNLTALYAEHPEFQQIIGSNGKDKRFRNNIFEKIPLFSETAEDDDNIRVIGIINNKRVWRFFPSRFIDSEHENLKRWKVLVPSANGSGAIGEVIPTPLIGASFIVGPQEGYTQSFIGVGAFENENEAQASLKYVKSKFARCMLGLLKITQHNPPEKWRYVPLQNFTTQSDIDWSKPIPDIDRQLYAKYGLNGKEVAFIESHVKAME